MATQKRGVPGITGNQVSQSAGIEPYKLDLRYATSTAFLAAKSARGKNLTTAEKGDCYYDTTLNALQLYNGSAWVDALTGATLASGKIILGNSSNAAAAVTPSGDVTITSAGVTAIGAAKVTGAKLTAGKGYFAVATLTNTTTPVNVFGAGGAPIALTVTSVISIAQDTTASNIVLKQAANTVVSIAKGTVSGVPVGGASLSNTTYAAADVCTVESSGAGNSIVLITFTVV